MRDNNLNVTEIAEYRCDDCGYETSSSGRAFNHSNKFHHCVTETLTGKESFCKRWDH